MSVGTRPVDHDLRGLAWPATAEPTRTTERPSWTLAEGFGILKDPPVWAICGGLTDVHSDIVVVEPGDCVDFDWSIHMAIPTRPLCGDKPLRYVRAVDTDVRRTFRRARLLMRLIERRRHTGAPGLAGAA